MDRLTIFPKEEVKTVKLSSDNSLDDVKEELEKVTEILKLTLNGHEDFDWDNEVEVEDLEEE